MDVIITRPYDQSNGEYHVHAAGCKDARNRRIQPTGAANVIPMTNVTSQVEIADYVFEDIISDNGGGTGMDYLSYFHFVGCVKLPVTSDRKKSYRYREVELHDLKALLSETDDLTDEELAVQLRRVARLCNGLAKKL